MYVDQKLWLTVQQIPGHQIQSHGTNHVDDRVLLDKHSRKYNRYSDNTGESYRPWVLLQCGGMAHGCMHSDGVEYMNTFVEVSEE